MTTDTCALTGKAGKFVDCHLYPRSFYKDTSDASRLKLMIADAPYKRSPVGVYDSSLVIAETEQWFAKLDDAAFRVLRPFESVSELLDRSSKSYVDGNETLGCETDEYEFQNLALFFVRSYGVSPTPVDRKRRGSHSGHLRSH